MVETEGKRDEVARVSLVSTKGVLLDEYVLPEGKITDYRTQYSGITPELLASCKNSPYFCHFKPSLQIDSAARLHRNHKDPIDFSGPFLRERPGRAEAGSQPHHRHGGALHASSSRV